MFKVEYGTNLEWVINEYDNSGAFVREVYSDNARSYDKNVDEVKKGIMAKCNELNSQVSA